MSATSPLSSSSLLHPMCNDSQEVKSQLVSMATLPISLSAAALATTFTVKTDPRHSPFSSSSSSSCFSFNDVCYDVSSPTSPQSKTSSSPQARPTSMPSSYPPIGDLSPLSPPPAPLSATYSSPPTLFVFNISPEMTSSNHTMETSLYNERQQKDSHPDVVQRPVKNSTEPEITSATIKAGSPVSDLGEILMGLREEPSYALFSVAVVHCRGMAADKPGNKDWYLKLYLRSTGASKQVKKRRTNIHRAHVNPVFNEIFHFHNKVEPASLDVVLCVKTGRMRKDQRVGRFRIDLRGATPSQPRKELFKYYGFGSVKR